MRILPFEKSDMEEVKGLQPAGWPDILPHMQYYLESEQCKLYKLMHEDKMAGIGAVIFHERTAWLAHIIVHPGQRNKGLGSRITQYLVDSTDRSLYETILLIATDFGEPVYTKIGFTVETEYLFFTHSDHAPSTYEINSVLPIEEKHFAEVLALDLIISGEDRSWRLKNHFEGALVHVKENKVDGYYLPSLGEGLIIASDPEAGISLMMLRNSKVNSCAIPIDNKSGIAHLLNNGFKEAKRAKRMRLGKKIHWQPENLYNRISGQIG